MSEELEKTDETQGARGNQGENGAATEDELATIKAQLEQERATLAAAQAALAAKDEAITTLEAHIAGLQGGFDAKVTELDQANQARAMATGKYLETVRAVTTGIPPDLIAGETVEEIDSSVARAQAIADAVRASLAAETRNARVPAGAPTRAVNIDALSPSEKIALGLQQEKGGNQ